MSKMPITKVIKHQTRVMKKGGWGGKESIKRYFPLSLSQAFRGVHVSISRVFNGKALSNRRALCFNMNTVRVGLWQRVFLWQRVLEAENTLPLLPDSRNLGVSLGFERGESSDNLFVE